MAAALGGFSFPVTVLLAAAGKVEVEVTGAITPYCANSVTAVPINLTDPRKAGSAKFAFTIDCNAPFRYTMRSDNGALRLADAPAALSSDQIEVAYDVRIRIPLNHGTVIDDTCSSKSIKHGAINCDFTNRAKTAIKQHAETQISWNDTHIPLLAGQYTDRLTVFVSVKP